MLTVRRFPAVTSFGGTSICQLRFSGQKPKKKNKAGAKFITDSQTWRDEWRKSRELIFADSLRKYITISSTQRKVPYDARFAPFDREERDGVYILMKHLMEDKLAMTHNHGHPVKKLMCNVGLLGPQVTTVARWKPKKANMGSAAQTTLGQIQVKKEKDHNGYFFNE